MWERQVREGFLDDDDDDGRGCGGKGSSCARRAATEREMTKEALPSSAMTPTTQFRCVNGCGGRQSATPRRWMKNTVAIAVLLAAVYAESQAAPVEAAPVGSCPVKQQAAREHLPYWNAWTTTGCDMNCASAGSLHAENAVCAYVDPVNMSPAQRVNAVSCQSSGRKQDTKRSCRHNGDCLVECMTVQPVSNSANEWEFRLGDAEASIASAARVQIGELHILPRVTKLIFDGSTSEGKKTAVDFHAGFSSATSLRSMVFISIDFSSSTSSFPSFPDTLTELQIVDCVLEEAPMDQISQLKNLASLSIRRNIFKQDASKTVNLSPEQFAFIRSRSIAREASESVAATSQVSCPDGKQSQLLNGMHVCVGDVMDIQRRLQTANSTTSSTATTRLRSQNSTTSNSTSSSEDSDSDDSFMSQSIYVLASLGAPALYFLYKLGLYLYFYATYSKHQRDVRVTVPTKVGDDSEDRRTTENVSSGSVVPPESIVLPPPPADQRRFNNMSFWVDEELQHWRMDFKQVKMIKCITTTSNQKRHVRNSTAATAISGCEIWLGTFYPQGAPDAEQPVVLKYIPPKQKEPQSTILDKFKGEIKRQAQFSHPNVVKFFGIVWSMETHLVAVTEYMARGDLRQWLHRSAVKEGGHWTVQKVQILLDVASALLYLHSMRPPLVHGNCNSRNVLLSDRMKAKLSDFGSSKELLSERELMAYSAVGSGRWISPEALVGRDTTVASRNDAADVYSFGILMSEVDTHELPFSDLMQTNRSALPETDILQLIAKGALTPTLSPTCHPGVGALIEQCTSFSPKDRPSCRRVVHVLQEIIKSIKATSAADSDSDDDDSAVHVSTRSRGVVV